MSVFFQKKKTHINELLVQMGINKSFDIVILFHCQGTHYRELMRCRIIFACVFPPILSYPQVVMRVDAFFVQEQIKVELSHNLNRIIPLQSSWLIIEMHFSSFYSRCNSRPSWFMFRQFSVMTYLKNHYLFCRPMSLEDVLFHTHSVLICSAKRNFRRDRTSTHFI